MADNNYAAKRLSAAQFLMDEKFAPSTTSNAAFLASGAGRPAFSAAARKFQDSYNADPAAKVKLDDVRDMDKLTSALRDHADRQAALRNPASPAPDLRNNENDARRLDRAAVATAPATPGAAAGGAAFDPEVQKAQGYLRALGVDDADVNGQKQVLKVDGIQGPITNAALSKYRTDHGLDNNASLAQTLQHMEERIQKNPAQIGQFVSETNADGAQASPSSVMGMQLVLNLLAPLIKTLSGGKIDMEALKIDGINGPRTKNALVAYDTQMNKAEVLVDPTKPAVTTDPANTSAPAINTPAAPASDDPLGDYIQQREAQEQSQEQAPPAENGRRADAVQVAAGENAAPTRRERYEMNRGGRPDGVPSQTGMRQDFRAATGMAGIQDNLRMRGELRAMGYAPAVAADLVRQQRTDDLVASGMDPRMARQAITRENALANRQENWEQRSAGREQAQEMRYERQRMAATERGISQDRRDFGNLGSGVGQMIGMRGSEASSLGRMAGAVAGIFGRVSANNGHYASASMNERQARMMGNDLVNVVRGGMVLGGESSREANGAARAVGAATNIIGRTGIFNGEPEGRVVTYPPQAQRPGYVSAARIDQDSEVLSRGNQLTPHMAAAAKDGVTPEQRAQIIADYERHKASAPQNTAPEAEAPSAQNNTRQSKDIYSPA